MATDTNGYYLIIFDKYLIDNVDCISNRNSFSLTPNYLSEDSNTFNLTRRRQSYFLLKNFIVTRSHSIGKIEKLISDMLNPRTGVPIGIHKAFLKDIPYAFTGYDLIEWMLEKFDIEDTEALHLANSICRLGYIFPVNDLKNLCVKDDSTLYRFQTSFFWLSHNLNNEDTDYAIYLVKRNLDTSKENVPLELYEEENLEKLQLKLGEKWEFVCLQAEQQNKLAKERRKNDKVVLDSQERAFWRVHRPPPNTFDPLETTPILNAQPNRNRKKTLENLAQEIEDLKQNFTRCRWKTSDVIQSYITRWENYYEFDPFIVKVEPSNPWISDDNALWCQNPNILTTKRLKLWSLSFKELLKDDQGINQFLEFLRKEYSSENIRFWQACQDYKVCSASEKPEAMSRIYKEFLAPNAPKEINIDSYSRELVNKGVREGSRYALDLAQDHIYTLMKKDSYVRYLRSDLYKNLVAAAQNAQKKKMILGFNFGNFLHHPHFVGGTIQGLGPQQVGTPGSPSAIPNYQTPGAIIQTSSSSIHQSGSSKSHHPSHQNYQGYRPSVKKNTVVGEPDRNVKENDVYLGPTSAKTIPVPQKQAHSIPSSDSDKKQATKIRPMSAKMSSSGGPPTPSSSGGLGRKYESISSHLNVLDSEIHSHNYNQALHPLLVATGSSGQNIKIETYQTIDEQRHSIQHSSSMSDIIIPTNNNSIILTSVERNLESGWSGLVQSPSHSTLKISQNFNPEESHKLIETTTGQETKRVHHHRHRTPKAEDEITNEFGRPGKNQIQIKSEAYPLGSDNGRSKGNVTTFRQSSQPGDVSSDTPDQETSKTKKSFIRRIESITHPTKVPNHDSDNGLVMKLPLSFLEREINSPSKPNAQNVTITGESRGKKISGKEAYEKAKRVVEEEIREITIKSPAHNTSVTPKLKEGKKGDDSSTMSSLDKKSISKNLNVPPGPKEHQRKKMEDSVKAPKTPEKNVKADISDICPWEDEVEVEKVMKAKKEQKLSTTLDKDMIETVCPWEDEDEVERILKAEKEKKSVHHVHYPSEEKKNTSTSPHKIRKLPSDAKPGVIGKLATIPLPNLSTGILSSPTVGLKQSHYTAAGGKASLAPSRVKEATQPGPKHKPTQKDPSPKIVETEGNNINEVCPWEDQEEILHLNQKRNSDTNYLGRDSNVGTTGSIITEREKEEICPWETEEAIECFEKKKIPVQVPVEVIDIGPKRNSIVHRFSNIDQAELESSPGPSSPSKNSKRNKNTSSTQPQTVEVVGNKTRPPANLQNTTNTTKNQINILGAQISPVSPSHKKRSFINRKK